VSSDRTYRAAVIGLGFVGAGDQVSGDALGQRVANLDGTHAVALNQHPRVELVAGSSRDEGRRQRFSEREGVSCTYADWREMLAKERLDIVSIATNSPYHAEIGIACADAGVECIFCEKPITTKLSDADRFIGVCQERGVLLVINHNRRWAPVFQMAKQAIADGEIGELLHVSALWTTGRLGNVGTHAFDAVRHITGLDAIAVSGELDTTGRPDCRGAKYRDPGGWGVVKMTDDVKMFVHAPDDRPVPWTIRIVGSEGQVVMHSKHGVIEPLDGEPRVITAPPDSPSSVWLAVDEIVRCLDGDATPTSTGEDGRATLEIIVGFHVSDARNGQWVGLPINEPDRKLEVKVG